MLFFENVWAKSVDFEFLRENFPKLAKFLGCSQNLCVLHLKCKNVTKKLIFTKLFASFVVQSALNAIFGPNE